MRILRLKADGFGPLRGEFVFDPARLTLVVDENERGKSSLLAAIAAALYGLDKDQRSHRHVTPLDRWRPWDGGSYRVELEVEHQGERLEIRRDFSAQLVAVWDERGRERTEEFREGKEDYPVGKALLGLDAAGFEKCALFRHGELDQVVPDREPERRESTLLARLEAAADTRAGDASAIEALRVLDEAAARYECAEASANLISLDVAIRRLELKEQTLDTDLGALEKQREDLREPLEELASALGAERSARARLGALEAERRATRIADLDARLRQDDDRRAEIEELRAEAEALRREPRLDDAAAAELREGCGRLEGAERHAAALERRDAETRAAIEALATERAALAEYEPHDAASADALAAAAQELRRLDADLERAGHEIDALPSGAPARDSESAARHAARFQALSDDELDLLQSHAEAMLAFQTRAAEAAGRKNDALTASAALDAQRRRREIPGWILLVIGIFAGLGAAAAWYLEMPWIPELTLGLALLTIGILLLYRAEDGVRDPRDAALAKIASAETEIASVRTQQIVRQQRLADLAAEVGLDDARQLLDAWADHRAWRDERGPVEPLERQRASLERRRTQIEAETRARLGDVAVTPETLEIAASAIRRLVALREKHEAAESEARRLAVEIGAHARDLETTRERARELCEIAGIELRFELPLGPQMEHAWAAAERGSRLAEIESALARGIARPFLDSATREALVHEHQALAGEDGAGVADATREAGSYGGTISAHDPRPLAEIDAEIARLRDEIDALQARRSGQLARFEERAQRIQDEVAAKGAERAAAAGALARARRFQSALALARATIDAVAWETHRHWAAFLNERVGGIVRAMSTEIADIRFGEDLDFSIKLPTGLQIPRGKAVRQLSSGARDQLHFAVRIAIGEYLSKGRAPMPLLLDDCFATSDDARARAGLMLLVEHVLREHQVILVTCHRKRHEALAELDATAWRERIQWIDARPAQIEAPAG